MTREQITEEQRELTPKIWEVIFMIEDITQDGKSRGRVLLDIEDGHIVAIETNMTTKTFIDTETKLDKLKREISHAPRHEDHMKG